MNDVDLAWHGEIAESEPALYSIIDAAGLSHGKGMKSYLIMMAVRLLEMRRVLKTTGNIYLHCDDTASHYLKIVMDAVFGKFEGKCQGLPYFPSPSATSPLTTSSPSAKAVPITSTTCKSFAAPVTPPRALAPMRSFS